MTQTDAARLAGIDQPNLSAIERGRRIPTPEMAHRIVSAIRGWDPHRFQMSLANLVSLEVGREAVSAIVNDPTGSRTAMLRSLQQMAERDDGSSAAWIQRWGAILHRWDVEEVLSLLLSSDTEDLSLRNAAPLDGLVSKTQRAEALARARRVWDAAGRP